MVVQSMARFGLDEIIRLWLGDAVSGVVKSCPVLLGTEDRSAKAWQGGVWSGGVSPGLLRLGKVRKTTQ